MTQSVEDLVKGQTRRRHGEKGSGDQFEKNGVTVIPAAKVMGGGGGGADESPNGEGQGSGSGFGIAAKRVLRIRKRSAGEALLRSPHRSSPSFLRRD